MSTSSLAKGDTITLRVPREVGEFMSLRWAPDKDSREVKKLFTGPDRFIVTQAPDEWGWSKIYKETDPAVSGYIKTRLGGLDVFEKTKDSDALKAAADQRERTSRATAEKTEQSGPLAEQDYSATRLDPEVLLEMVNEHRRLNSTPEKPLKPLKLDGLLTHAAMQHSRDLAKWDRISHYGSDGSNPWDRIKRSGFNAKLGAENVGTGQRSMRDILNGWIASPGHNKNLLLPDAEYVGFALVKDTKTDFKTFWTMAIGTSLDAQYKRVPIKSQEDYFREISSSPAPAQKQGAAPAIAPARHASIGDAFTATAEPAEQKKYAANTRAALTPPPA